MTVPEYYLRTYNRRLQYPNLCCLNVSKNPGVPTYVPMEIASVVKGQRLAIVRSATVRC